MTHIPIFVLQKKYIYNSFHAWLPNSKHLVLFKYLKVFFLLKIQSNLLCKTYLSISMHVTRKHIDLYPEYFGIRAGIISIQPLVRTLLVTSAMIGQVTPSTVVLCVHGQTQTTVSHHVLALVNLNWNSNVILTCLHGVER